MLTVLDEEYRKNFIKLNVEERASWVTRQLKNSGFVVEPIGSNWGVLKD